MSAASSQLVIKGAILRGINTAYKKYYLMASEPLEDAPEYFVTVQIAAALSKKAKPCWVTLESQIKYTLHTADAQRRGRYAKAAGAKGRFDIVLWYKVKDQPRAIIEVKHPINIAAESRIKRDIERICRVLKQGKELGSSLKLGYFAFFSYARYPKKIDGTATARMKRRLKDIERLCKSIATEHGCTAKLWNGRIHHRDGDEVWAPCTVVFRAKGIQH